MFSVKVTPNSLEKMESGSILGHIWVEVDDFSFPSQGWDDFPVVILGWWLEGLVVLLSKAGTSREFLFMDGPFHFDANRKTEGLLALRFYQRGVRDNICVAERTVSAKSFVKEIVSAANLVIRICREKTWQTRDLDTLVSQYKIVTGKVSNPLSHD